MNNMATNVEEEQRVPLEQPMSPSSQCMNSSALSLSILVFFELETEILDSKLIQFLHQKIFTVQRFSSIVVRDEKTGLQRWRKLADHDLAHDYIVNHIIKVPSFPNGLSPKDYDKHLEDYINKIHKEGFPDTKPLWEVHLIKYPTTNAAATLIFKLHHALGDGFSLMGILFSCFQRADDPSLPPTFPTSSSKKPTLRSHDEAVGASTHASKYFKKGFQLMSTCWDTLLDFGETLLRGEDDPTVIRSGNPAVEFEPCRISSLSFALQDIAFVKSKVGGTVNDVVLGIAFHGIRLYMQKMGQKSNDAQNVTALVVLNTRMLTGYQKVDDMAKANNYGNRVSFFYLCVPSGSVANKSDPMDFVLKAKEIMRRKKNSMGIHLTSKLLQLLENTKGSLEVSHRIYSNFKNTSLAISNMVGPKEKIAIGGHPIKGFYFVGMGLPQSLGISIMSYMGQLRMVVKVEREFIDSELIVSCMKEAFGNIFESFCENIKMEKQMN